MPDRSPADGYDAERCVGPFEWSRAGLKKGWQLYVGKKTHAAYVSTA